MATFYGLRYKKGENLYLLEINNEGHILLTTESLQALRFSGTRVIRNYIKAHGLVNEDWGYTRIPDKYFVVSTKIEGGGYLSFTYQNGKPKSVAFVPDRDNCTVFTESRAANQCIREFCLDRKSLWVRPYNPYDAGDQDPASHKPVRGMLPQKVVTRSVNYPLPQ